MIKESLPIKCLEAVILGIYLTNGVAGLERYPLGFRSVFGSNVHRHVVLVVSWNGLFGALGMSRRADLMYKPLQFSVSNQICFSVSVLCLLSYFDSSIKFKVLVLVHNYIIDISRGCYVL